MQLLRSNEKQMSYVIILQGSTKHEQFLTLIDFSSRLTELRYLGTVISFREQVVKLDQASFPAKSSLMHLVVLTQICCMGSARE